MRTSWSRTLAWCAAAGAAALVGSGVGFAVASPGEVRIAADSTIIGCVQIDTRAVRIVERARYCRDSEEIVKWSQVGPAGPAGPAGPSGPEGPPGVDGRTIGYFGAQPTSPAPPPLKLDQLSTIVTITGVAVGAYQGTISSIITTDGLPRGIDVNVYCRVIDDTNKASRTVNFFAPPNRWSTVSGQVLFRVNTDGADVKLRCKGDPATLLDTRLSIVKVTN